MASEIHIFSQDDRRVSLTNMRRLDSRIDQEAAEKARRQTCPENVTFSVDPPAESIKITKTQAIDDTLKEIRVDGWGSVVKANSLIMRIFWLIVSFLCLAVLIYEFVAVLINYFTRPLSTSYQIVTNESMILPDIYLCPLNSINWTVIDKEKQLLTYAFYLKQINGVQDYEGNVGKASATARMFNYTITDAYEKFMQFGYNIEEFMPACSFSGSFTKYLRCGDIVKERMDGMYGKCFLLSLGPEMVQTSPGRGLTMTFNLHKELYPTLSLFAPTIEGVALLIGDELTYLRPGSHYNVEIRAEHLKFINIDRGSVHHHCVDGDAQTVKFSVINRDQKNYNQRDCINDCYVREIWNICQCLPVIDPSKLKPEILNGSQPVMLCDAVRYNKCVHPRVDNNATVRARVDHCKSHCRVPCDYTRYQMKASDAPLHALGYQYVLDYYNTTIDNLIFVALSYPALDYTEFQQDISKSFDELVSDLGGQVGLWLGASMVTIIQIPFLLTMLCMRQSASKVDVVRGAMAKRVKRFSQATIVKTGI